MSPAERVELERFRRLPALVEDLPEDLQALAREMAEEALRIRRRW